jgi:hypothetical protein
VLVVNQSTRVRRVHLERKQTFIYTDAVQEGQELGNVQLRGAALLLALWETWKF